MEMKTSILFNQHLAETNNDEVAATERARFLGASVISQLPDRISTSRAVLHLGPSPVKLVEF